MGISILRKKELGQRHSAVMWTGLYLKLNEYLSGQRGPLYIDNIAGSLARIRTINKFTVLTDQPFGFQFASVHILVVNQTICDPPQC